MIINTKTHSFPIITLFWLEAQKYCITQKIKQRVFNTVLVIEAEKSNDK